MENVFATICFLCSTILWNHSCREGGKGWGLSHVSNKHLQSVESNESLRGLNWIMPISLLILFECTENISFQYNLFFKILCVLTNYVTFDNWTSISVAETADDAE